MNERAGLTEEQLEFLTEMANVGAGNAATALSQILQSEVELLAPEVYFLPFGEMPSFLTDPSLPVVAARMRMVGDMTGNLFFIMEENDALGITKLAERVTPGVEDSSEADYSTLAEMANIVAGVYLTAIREFCGLKIYYTIPCVATDMVQALVDESIAVDGWRSGTMLAIDNQFVGKGHDARGTLLMIPSMDSREVLSKAIQNARMVLGLG